ncbi:Uncharacterized protein BP5553_00208 [Venustampulla echinocandica]|uniref:NAD-dependent epimerase/dehydratase domain-containing protein n=1 Tax=Venustampulla echinocandica TaxID=2656787 RepID=A0A370TXK3_9HELO|nr:Uncharacterized protein BP5553_00208 [Venustampulla echinocandica]RDL40229.1 Uncharacterized protein BP5553_00208 [Venustampulla echinocandica]
MRVFVTGATGFVGTAIVQDLLKAGHQVLGLARSDASAKALTDAGADVLRGSLDDLDILKKGATECDGVIHTAFTHDWSNYAGSCTADRKAIEAIGAALKGSGRPFVVTSGTLSLGMLELPPDQFANEEHVPDSRAGPRGPSEAAALELVSKGVRVTVVRLPIVHGDDDHGFIPMLIAAARKNDVSAYVGDGNQRWPSVRKADAATLYRLALEKGVAGAKYHAIAEQGVAIKDIAEVIGGKLDLPVVGKSPEEAAENFGFLSWPLAIDNPTSSKITQEQLGWSPSGRGLIEDMEKGTYFKN